MIRSMTGYGKATGSFKNKKITVEIRSLNSKQLDLNIRVPQLYRDRELDLRNWASRQLDRGRVDITVSEESGEEAFFAVSENQFRRYYADLIRYREELKETSDLLPVIMRLPDVIKATKDEAGEEEWNTVLSIASGAAEKFNAYRESEGRSLAKDLTIRIEKIEALTTEVEQLEPARTENIRQRLKTAIENNNITADADRFEQEIIFYLEKLDITEEKVRLITHCRYFIETMNSGSSEGRKLNFISQEIGREINTMGSKANDAGIQKLVVQMKDELEKIKEQVNNVL